MNKRDLKLLEKVFSAEISGLLPFQSKSKRMVELVQDGYLREETHITPTPLGPLRIHGYTLTHSGRHEYCASCKGIDDDL